MTERIENPVDHVSVETVHNGRESKTSASKMEMAASTWIARGTRFMVEPFPYVTVILSDHAAFPSMVKQTKLTTTDIDKLNLRLTRALQYLSQFRKDVGHSRGKKIAVADMISRLLARKSPEAPSYEDYEGPEGHLDNPEKNVAEPHISETYAYMV